MQMQGQGPAGNHLCQRPWSFTGGELFVGTSVCCSLEGGGLLCCVVESPPSLVWLDSSNLKFVRELSCLFCVFLQIPHTIAAHCVLCFTTNISHSV